MMRADLVVAQYANTRGSRVNDPDLERYLRDEYPGGMTVEALLAGTVRPNGGVRAAFVRFVKPSCGTSIGSSPRPPRWPPEGARDRGGARKKYPRDGGDTPMVHIIAILFLLARYAAEWVRFQ